MIKRYKRLVLLSITLLGVLLISPCPFRAGLKSAASFDQLRTLSKVEVQYQPLPTSR
jgi:hypothetical protein